MYKLASPDKLWQFLMKLYIILTDKVKVILLYRLGNFNNAYNKLVAYGYIMRKTNTRGKRCYITIVKTKVKPSQRTGQTKSLIGMGSYEFIKIAQNQDA